MAQPQQRGEGGTRISNGEPQRAEHFRDALRQLTRDETEKSWDFRKQGRQPAETIPDGTVPPEPLLSRHQLGQQTDADDIDATAGNLSQHVERALGGKDLTSGPATAPDPSAAELATKFSERLALATANAGETHLILDTSRYLVSSVTISGRADAGLSLAYDGRQGDGDQSSSEEALRERLAARGFKVDHIERLTSI